MSYLIGIAIAALVVLLGSVGGFDRERGFYPTILMVVASYYVLFAAHGVSDRFHASLDVNTGTGRRW